MQALILNDDRRAQAATAMALFKRNFQVVTAEDVDTASAYADLGVFDLVVMAERVGDRLSHAVALSAELRNPDVTTMVVTPRADADVDELYDLLPSLYCLLGEDLSPELMAKMAVAGVVGSLAVADRGRSGVDLAGRDAAAGAGAGPDRAVDRTGAMTSAKVAGSDADNRVVVAA
ncbi:hypothetical protein [Marimonas arenosa]|uniref:Uncharacterized protein n=1 Tax=Marimonas arenosa TaxID=1795305 RepID=A0AAE4B4Z1_9RHOB|nr:hypothetical protein [Marimonas arenosa]MDQ2091548.1 hypothetical protein [Marimonas arenosa]